MARAASWLASVVLASTIGVSLSGTRTWKWVADRDGVTVDRSVDKQGGIPTFRAMTTITARPVEILAVLQDFSRHCEWAPNCEQVTLVEQTSPRSRFTYVRNRPPRPVSPRDTVVFTEFWVYAGGDHVRSTFEARSHSKRPEVDGWVRITSLHGHYELHAIDADHTSVEYLVTSDPGGNVPAWLVEDQGAKLPLASLRGLRDQVARTRGRYGAFLGKWE